MIRRIRLLAVLAALPLTSGCIAAAALPVLAGGAVAKSTIVEKEAAPPKEAYPVDSVVVQTQLTSLPAPTDRIPAAPTPYAAFAAYAREQSRAYLPNEKRYSAILADPGSLKPVTEVCTSQPPAVLIDLDPGDGVFDSARFGNAGDLGETLTLLRERGVTVLWLSGASVDRADAIRAVLRQSGLDLSGGDRLSLTPAGERKQTIRMQLGEDFCIEAIAGDRRADFDELYDYLLDESSAASLEPMIGNGWFLVPSPQ